MASSASTMFSKFLVVIIVALEPGSFDANVLLASRCRWSSVERTAGQHRGRMMRGSGGFMGKASFTNLSRRELGDWPGPNLDVNKV